MTATVLLGAGATRDAGLPTSAELLRLAGAKFEDPRLSALFEGIRSGVGMRAASAQLAGLYVPPVNIEDVANAAEALINRRHSDIAPFIASWHELLDDMDHAEDVPVFARERVAGMLQRKFVDAQQGRLDTIATDWSEWARELIQTFAMPTRHDTLLERMQREIPRVVAELLQLPDTAPVDYLGELLRLIKASTGLAIATLNYDLGIERVAEKAETRYSDGIDAWGDGNNDLFGDVPLRLYKLHGSLNWQRDSQDIYRRLVTDVLPQEPGIIFGGKNKLTTRGPYLDLLWRWRAELSACDQLLIAGYSFADNHVNSLLVQWARLEGKRRIVLIDPGFDDNNLETAKWIRRHSDRSRYFTLHVLPRGASEAMEAAVDFCSSAVS